MVGEQVARISISGLDGTTTGHANK